MVTKSPPTDRNSSRVMRSFVETSFDLPLLCEPLMPRRNMRASESAAVRLGTAATSGFLMVGTGVVFAFFSGILKIELMFLRFDLCQNVMRVHACSYS